MRVKQFIDAIGADFYAGVPDSLLSALCDYLMDTYGIDPAHHLIAANEGNCAALAAGYHLATGKIPVVYMQNSGEGNIINPAASLLNKAVYGIPIIFIVGWRGEPGIHDEPQHIYQGKITVKLMEDMGIKCFIADSATTENELTNIMKEFRTDLSESKNVAFIIRKGALSYDHRTPYTNTHSLVREEVIRRIAKAAGQEIIVSTTGKISRELYDIRTVNGESHKYDFLTVGSMGHSSSIALGIAIQKPSTTVWCIDGDGAVLMHMGALAVLGATAPSNLIHIVINNGAHETVGGMPTSAQITDIAGVAKACGYPYAASVDTYEDLEKELRLAKERNSLCMIEVKCSLGSRGDLGRPAESPQKNKEAFMAYLRTL